MGVRGQSRLLGAIMALALMGAGCGGGSAGTSQGDASPTSVAAPDAGDPADDSAPEGDTGGAIDAARGVDPASKVIRIGSLFDLSGPLAVLGVPWEAAVTAGVEQLNSSGELGDWTVEIVERDHGMNPSSAVGMYEEIKDDVALIFPTFGSVTTAPLLPRLADDNMLAFVAGGATSSQTDHSVWGFSSYRTEAMRAVDHAVEDAGDDAVLGIIVGPEDSGADAISGFRAAAEALDVEIAEEITVEVEQNEFTAVITRLQEAGVTHACICVGAGHSGGILATAASRGYAPQWYGMLPTFLEAAFYGALPPDVWEDNFLWINGIPYWGEDRPGMQEFVADYEASSAAQDFPPPQGWGLIGFLHVRMLGEVLSVAIENGDLSPEGIIEAARSVDEFDAGGLLLAPIDLLGDGEATTVTRVLRPDVANRTWEVVGEAKSLDW